MAKNLKPGEQVTVDRTIEFDSTSESFEKGLLYVEAGHVGVVIGPALEGRASIVEFSGVQATVTNQRLMRAADKPLGKKRGRKKQVASTDTGTGASKRESANRAINVSIGETSLQLMNQLANALLLSGGLKEDENTVVQLRFAELPYPIQTQLRALIAAKLALNSIESKQ